MRRLALAGLFVACCFSAFSLGASEVITCRSPDKKFALRCASADKQPYNGQTAMIDAATRKTVLVLDSNWTLGQVKLVWSPDSQRVAYFFEKGNDCEMRLFSRGDSGFNEIALPDLPSPKLPANATSESNTSTRTEPMGWSGSSELLVEKELVSPDWGRAALKIVLEFDQNNQPSIRSTEPERISIIDYFLLLPAKDFEAPLAAWLRLMRTDNDFSLCNSKPRKNIDEKNGYMYCRGDGAQPEFEVALFRHKDGRPLLGLCSGELEGADSTQLEFFELGADGTMQPISHPILPATDLKYDPEVGYEKEGCRFVLPRTGKTILVRKQKGGKILHKFTWTGESFSEEK